MYGINRKVMLIYTKIVGTIKDFINLVGFSVGKILGWLNVLLAVIWP